MAVTSLWPIKGRVDRVINYTRNPEKTTEGSYEELASLHVVDDVVEYAANDMKTERRSYVSCLNCEEETAAHQFIETKKIWQRVSGRDKMGGGFVSTAISLSKLMKSQRRWLMRSA